MKLKHDLIICKSFVYTGSDGAKRFLHIVGIVIWGILAAFTLVVANRVEKVKKELDIQTYKEIVAFMNGEKLDEIEKQKERKKLKNQRIGLAISGGAIALVVGMVMVALLY